LKTKIIFTVVFLFVFVAFNIYLHNSQLNSESYRVTMNFLSNSNNVTELLGKPYRFSVPIFRGWGQQGAPAGELKAQYRINIYGEKNKGTAEIRLESQLPKWFITEATLILENGNKVNLLESMRTP